jgi:hypothetical protein
MATVLRSADPAYPLLEAAGGAWPQPVTRLLAIADEVIE